jgi:tRNA dimethylallyltransferase
MSVGAKALAIIGPTACGKTALALEVAKRRPVEIISMDSALVYRGMDIGTAKPTAQELAAVPHHLVNILEPTQSYSAAQFVRDATRLVGEINARGKAALIVGGTMLYLKALVQGLDDMPAASPEIRAEIDAQARALGWPAMHAELARVDAITAARLSPNDSQRIQRALEVHRATGQPISALQRQNMPNNATAGVFINKLAINFEAFPILSLEPESRAWLHERIAQRLQAMLAQGLIAEVGQLKNRGDLSLDLPSMRCVGYRQTWDMLSGTFPAHELADKAIAATRQLAKRQVTWQRGMQPPAFHKHVVAADSPTALHDAAHWIVSKL